MPLIEMPAGEFKAKCLRVLDRVQRTRQGVVITKHGHPVAQLVALPSSKRRKSFKGSLIEERDLLSPIDVEWDAEK
jgi:prevent-host-death family protein